MESQRISIPYSLIKKKCESLHISKQYMYDFYYNQSLNNKNIKKEEIDNKVNILIKRIFNPTEEEILIENKQIEKLKKIKFDILEDMYNKLNDIPPFIQFIRECKTNLE